MFRGCLSRTGAGALVIAALPGPLHTRVSAPSTLGIQQPPCAQSMSKGLVETDLVDLGGPLPGPLRHPARAVYSRT